MTTRWKIGYGRKIFLIHPDGDSCEIDLPQQEEPMVVGQELDLWVEAWIDRAFASPFHREPVKKSEGKKIDLTVVAEELTKGLRSVLVAPSETGLYYPEAAAKDIIYQYLQ